MTELFSAKGFDETGAVLGMDFLFPILKVKALASSASTTIFVDVGAQLESVTEKTVGAADVLRYGEGAEFGFVGDSYTEATS
jgi:hypothetical protein